MAYLGKEYKLVKEENFEAFANSLQIIGIPAALLLGQFSVQKPVSKLVKDGDTYTMTSVTGDKTITAVFKSGEGMEIEYVPAVKLYSIFTVDGNTVNQIIKRNKDDDTFVTLKREYDGDNMKMTITASIWDGACTRYYSVQ